MRQRRNLPPRLGGTGRTPNHGFDREGSLMIERPLDRLNYYNGQRLEAGDLKLEQEYHIRVRRWINKSLCTPGIASGLDIREQKGTRFVIVSPGLALDAEGREI